jgi:molecular chaperone DnaK
MLYNVEKMLREHGDKISGSERGDVENAVADAKKALESNEKAQMDKALENADCIVAQAGRADVQGSAGDAGSGSGRSRRTGGTQGGDPSGNGQAKKDEGVIDAEYVDVEDKK